MFGDPVKRAAHHEVADQPRRIAPRDEIGKLLNGIREIADRHIRPDEKPDNGAENDIERCERPLRAEKSHHEYEQSGGRDDGKQQCADTAEDVGNAQKPDPGCRKPHKTHSQHDRPDRKPRRHDGEEVCRGRHPL